MLLSSHRIRYENGLQKVEAGAQGHHKIQRGYLPMPTWSLHWIADPRLRNAIQPYLERERLGIDAEMKELMEYSPYKNTTLKKKVLNLITCFTFTMVAIVFSIGPSASWVKPEHIILSKANAGLTLAEAKCTFIAVHSGREFIKKTPVTLAAPLVLQENDRGYPFLSLDVILFKLPHNSLFHFVVLAEPELQKSWHVKETLLPKHSIRTYKNLSLIKRTKSV